MAVDLSKRLTERTVMRRLGYTEDEFRRAADRLAGFPRLEGGKLVLGDVARLFWENAMPVPAEVQVQLEAEAEKAVAAEEADDYDTEADKVRSLNRQILEEKLAKAKNDSLLSRVRAETAAGQVVLVDEVVEAIAPLFVAISTELKSVGVKLGARLAKEGDAHKCRVMVDEMISASMKSLQGFDVQPIVDRASKKAAHTRSRDKDNRAAGGY